MAYITISAAAGKWGVTERRVQELCKNGSIQGATRFGRAWMIPEEADKPVDKRKRSSSDIAMQKQTLQMAMPFINFPYELGKAMESIETIEDIDSRNIALGEYYYFTGQSAKASEITEPYLTCDDLALCLSACWIYAYANLTLGRIQRTKNAMAQVQTIRNSFNENTPELYKALAVCVSTGMSVLLHLPMPKVLRPLKDSIHLLPSGFRLFVLYVEAHHCYLQKQYGASIGIAETALALESQLYPIPTIYLHLIAAIGYINLKHFEPAKEHLLKAWQIAKKDDMMQAFGEHHGLLGGLLEAVIKKEYPNDFARIISIAHSFFAGWRKIHNSETGNHVADDLTATEFTVAMLASKDWSNKEIGAHLGISVNTVKLHISAALQKLGISQRKELIQFMLK